MDFFKQIGSRLSKLSAGSAGGAAPPKTPLLRGAHLEERTVAGTPLCGARDIDIACITVSLCYWWGTNENPVRIRSSEGTQSILSNNMYN